MSFSLPTVDLTNAVAGTTGRIDLTNIGVGAGGMSANPAFIQNQASLYLFNDSGCGLKMAFPTGGSSFSLPAGAWKPVALAPGENTLNYLVDYVLPNPPVSRLLIDYYAPWEAIPAHTLGNSPIGGGTVATNQTLSNEANNANSLVIDAGVPGNTQLLQIFNDHFVWKVLQAAAHTVLQGQSSGNPLLLGQAGDITEVLGQLLLDAQLTATKGTLIDPVEANAGTNNIRINNPNVSGTTGIMLFNVDGDNFAVYSNGAGILNGKFRLLTGSLSRISVVNFTSVNGTTSAINHNLGAQPDVIVGNAFNTGVNASNVTLGFSEVNATTFKCSSIAAVAVTALCIRMA